MISAKAIYSDFDGTITKRDTVNTFFEMYADPSWLESEKSWVEGKITSRENALVQVGLIKPMSEKSLYEYIDSIELDDHFLDFCDYINRNNAQLTILSDGFDLFIARTLQKYGIGNVRFYANHLIHQNDRFSIEFPHYTASCKIGAGMCKCAKVTEGGYYYIGDGVTDLCVAKKAEILFASKYLNEHCNANAIPHVPFRDFGDILGYLTNLKS